MRLFTEAVAKALELLHAPLELGLRAVQLAYELVQLGVARRERERLATRTRRLQRRPLQGELPGRLLLEHGPFEREALCKRIERLVGPARRTQYGGKTTQEHAADERHGIAGHDQPAIARLN